MLSREGGVRNAIEYQSQFLVGHGAEAFSEAPISRRLVVRLYVSCPTISSATAIRGLDKFTLSVIWLGSVSGGPPPRDEP